MSDAATPDPSVPSPTSAPSDPLPRLEFAQRETIVVIGDSITQQNLYTAYLETFLIGRFPGKELSVWNLGWGGDVAPGGHQRFARDALGLQPTTVIVNFGMNDGSYAPPNAEVTSRWLVGITDLIADIRRAGARPILMTTSPVDERAAVWLTRYNETLGRFAGILNELARREGIACIDIFHPVQDALAAAQRSHPHLSLMPDGVHPTAPGHLLMADAALRHLALPPALGTLTITPTSAHSDGAARIDTVEAGAQSLSAMVELPYLPFWVPSDARPALALSALQEERNRFRLRAQGWPERANLSLRLDGVEVAVLSSEELAQGVDLALIEHAPWAIQGQQLWAQAQQRFALHFTAWRQLGLGDPPAAQALPSHRQLRDALDAYLHESPQLLRRLAEPRRYHLTLEVSRELLLSSAECSPLYPFAADRPEDFATRHPPETSPAAVSWTSASWREHALDLGAHFNAPSNCVCYVRVLLQASVASRVRLLLGSDDGLSVLLNGQRMLERNVFRACRLGDDSCELELPAGPSQLLLRVTQGGGGYGVAMKMLLLSGGPVIQLAPDDRSPRAKAGV